MLLRKPFLGVALVVLAALLLSGIVVSAQQPLARIRVAHLAPNTPAVEVFVNGTASGIQVLRFGEVSGWVELVAGTYSIAVAPAGAGIGAAAIGPVNVTLAADSWQTIAAIGTLGSTLRPAVISENYKPLTGTEARVTVFHGIEDAPAVDVILPDGTQVVSNLAFGRSAVVTVPSGVYSLAVVPAGATSPVVLSLNTPLDGATFYFVAAANRLAAPQWVVSAVPQARVAPLFNKVTRADIVDTLARDNRFDTLVAAVQSAGLVNALKGAGPLTVFAPTDAAFTTLLNELGITAEALLADKTTLTNVLLYHVIDGFAPASEVVKQTSLKTLLPGRSFSVAVVDGSVILNGRVKITATDLYASNGIIHVIDAVLLP